MLADGTGSRVVLDVVMRAGGLSRLFMPMIDRLTRNDLQGGFDRLKPILEQG